MRHLYPLTEGLDLERTEDHSLFHARVCVVG